MNTKFLKCLLSLVVFITLFAHLSGQKSASPLQKNNQANTVQVIQFHSEHRCVTCNLIEKLTRETLKESFPSVAFKLVNVDDPKNEKMAEEFEATGTALFIYQPSTKKKKDLTDFAFMQAKSKPKEFKKGVKDAIQSFGK